MPDDSSREEHVHIRTAYLQERIEEFVSGAKKEQNKELYSIHDAAHTVTLETFDLEERWIRPFVAHHNSDAGFLCRHKIIAATQCAIMRHAPLRNSEEELSSNIRAKEDGMWTPKIRKLNALFAHAVALHMLQLWMIEYKQPQQSLQCLESKDLHQTYRENIFWLFRSLSVTSHNIVPRFPFFLLAQFWSMVDRYASVQGGGTFPLYREESVREHAL